MLRGKELLLDRQGGEAKYPEKVPPLFRSAPVEDYDRNVCNFLCQIQNLNNASWESHYNYEFNTCAKRDYDATHAHTDVGLSNHDLYSVQDCPNETISAAIDYSVEYLRSEDANVHDSQLRNFTKIWIKSESNFFTIKNINIEKKFEEYLSEIGGNFGLFAGASILTIVEIVMLFVKIMKRIILYQRGIKKSFTLRVGEGKM